MDLEAGTRACARSDEPEARSAASGRGCAADGGSKASTAEVDDRVGEVVAGWPGLAGCLHAPRWLLIQADLGRAPRTIDAYARAVSDYLGFCERAGIEVLAASRADVAAYVRDLRERPGWRGANVVAIDSGAGLSNATLRLRLTAVRLFYD